MSAVQALWGRIGVATRGFGALANGFQIGSVIERRAAEVLPGPGADRAQSLLQRHVRSRGGVVDVLEIGRGGVDHAAWFDDGVRITRRDVVADNRPVDMAAVLAELPGRSVDLVLSVDSIEHVRTPWKVAAEIERLLRPGALTFHTTIFTTCYQPQPEDFFRFTPDGLKSLFGGLECLTAEFDATARHRATARRQPAGDIFGGSREGWRVTYCGRKPGLR